MEVKRTHCTIKYSPSYKVGEAIIKELFNRACTTSTNHFVGSGIITFTPLNAHSILRAFAICEYIRVKFHLEEVKFTSSEGTTYFRSHVR